ncbi:pyrimidine utilization protein D [Sphingomonas sp. ASY06-1R]|uniref:pyrimidine utilization protein D n=1 Tax=Sphingomonas sp. ASY06-1R TaxID=3445771 RepID=UPI003FA26FF1
MAEAAGLYYEIYGPPDGAPLLLSPGLGGSALYWNPNLAALAARYRVILYDHRGTGRSDRAVPADMTIDTMAQDVIALLDAIGIERVHFIGHALGGMIGLALAVRAPERLSKLVVVNGWAKLDPFTELCFDTRLALLRDSGPEAYVRAQPIFLYPAHWASACFEELEAEMAHQLASFPPVEVVERRIAALRAYDPGPDLHRIDLPVLVITTSDDLLVPWQAGRALAQALPNATRCQQFGGGHAASRVEPEEFHARVLPWLADEAWDDEEEGE